MYFAFPIFDLQEVGSELDRSRMIVHAATVLTDPKSLVGTKMSTLVAIYSTFPVSTIVLVDGDIGI